MDSGIFRHFRKGAQVNPEAQPLTSVSDEDKINKDEEEYFNQLFEQFSNNYDFHNDWHLRIMYKNVIRSSIKIFSRLPELSQDEFNRLFQATLDNVSSSDYCVDKHIYMLSAVLIKCLKHAYKIFDYRVKYGVDIDDSFDILKAKLLKALFSAVYKIKIIESKVSTDVFMCLFSSIYKIKTVDNERLVWSFADFTCIPSYICETIPDTSLKSVAKIVIAVMNVYFDDFFKYADSYDIEQLAIFSNIHVESHSGLFKERIYDFIVNNSFISRKNRDFSMFFNVEKIEAIIRAYPDMVVEAYTYLLYLKLSESFSQEAEQNYVVSTEVIDILSTMAIYYKWRSEAFDFNESIIDDIMNVAIFTYDGISLEYIIDILVNDFGVNKDGLESRVDMIVYDFLYDNDGNERILEPGTLKYLSTLLSSKYVYDIVEENRVDLIRAITG